MSTEVVIFTLVVGLANALFRYLPLRFQARFPAWAAVPASFLFVSCRAGPPARRPSPVPDTCRGFPPGGPHDGASEGPGSGQMGYK